MEPPSWLRRWLARRLLASSAGRRSGLSGVTVLPKRLTMPLRRDDMDPVPALSRMREDEPVARLGRVLGMTVWLVTGYRQARAVLEDAVNYSNDIRPILGSSADPDSAIGGLGFTDPPVHTRLRKILTPEFTGRRIARMLPVIESIVDQQLDLIAAQPGPVDLVTDFAFPVPFLVICELLGLPVEDRETFRRLGRARFDVTGGGGGTFGAMSQSREFLLGVVAEQRRHPGPGLLGSLIRAHGDELDDIELAGLADGLFTGGYETSASMLALGVLALLRDPKGLQSVAGEDDTVDRVVAELLRYLSVVQISFPRFARVDHDLFGKRVRAGDVVVCSLSGANRDPLFGSASGRFDAAAAPGVTHLAFGHGVHRCVGSELARLELRVAFRRLARRFPSMSLAVEPGELRFHDLSIVYGVQSLPVWLRHDDATMATTAGSPDGMRR